MQDKLRAKNDEKKYGNKQRIKKIKKSSYKASKEVVVARVQACECMYKEWKTSLGQKKI